MKTFEIRSSCGTITAEIKTGQVTNIDTLGDPKPDKYFVGIKRIDVDEYRKHYKREIKQNESIDILDLGYWYKLKREITGHFWTRGKEKYEEPAHDWRKEVKILRGNKLLLSA